MKGSATGFFVADIETDPFRFGREVRPFAAGLSDGAVAWTWWGDDCIQKLLAALRDREGICFFHNGGKFDLHHLFPHMTLRDLNPRPFMMGGRIVSLKWRRMEFRDSYSLVPKPLRSWAKDEMAYWRLEREHRERYREQILSYLRGDLRYLHEMMADLRERYFPKKSFPLTLAGLSFRILERDFGIHVPHTSRAFDRRLRAWYFGGRVSCWKLGRQDGDFRILDINSAYPKAMTEKHWWGEAYHISHDKRISGPSFYRIASADPRGAFPRRTREGIDFPTAAGNFNVSGWELLAAKRAGVPFRVLRRYRPLKLQDFSRYVKHFYGIKLNAKDKAERYWAKLMLNAPYGKLAQNDENYRETIIRPFRQWPKGKGWEIVSDDKTSGRSIFQRPARGFSRPYCVAAGAGITGCVRAALYGVIARNPGLLYCDTDSLIAPNPIRDCSIGNSLGEWKEEMRCDIVWIAGKKLYAAHNIKAPWTRSRPARTGWYQAEGKGWTPLTRTAWAKWAGVQDETLPEPWKFASKGVRLKVPDIIAVAEGHSRTYRQEAPSYGLGREPMFMTRRVVRADKRQSHGLEAAA